MRHGLYIQNSHFIIPEIHIKLHAFNGVDYWVLIQCAFNGILVGDGECMVKELTPRHEIVSREPVEDAFCLIGISISAVSSSAASSQLTLRMTGSKRLSPVS